MQTRVVVANSVEASALRCFGKSYHDVINSLQKIDETVCLSRICIASEEDLMHCLEQDYSDDTDYLYRLQHNSLVIELSKDLPEPVGASEKSKQALEHLNQVAQMNEFVASNHMPSGVQEPSLESNAGPATSTPGTFQEVGDAISPITPRIQAISDGEDDWNSLPAIPPKPSSLSQPPHESTLTEEDDALFSLRPPLPVRPSVQKHTKKEEIRKKSRDADDDFDWESFWKDADEEEKKPTLPSAPKPPIPSAPKPPIEREELDEPTMEAEATSPDWSDEMSKIPLSLGQNLKTTRRRRQSFSNTNGSKAERRPMQRAPAKSVSKSDTKQSQPTQDDWSDDELPVKNTHQLPPAQHDWSDDELPVPKPTRRQSFVRHKELPGKKPGHTPPSQHDWSDDELPISKNINHTPPTQQEWNDDELPPPKQTRRQSLIQTNKTTTHSQPPKTKSGMNTSVRQPHPLDDWSDDESPMKTHSQRSLDNWSDDSDLPAVKPTHPRLNQSDRRRQESRTTSRDEVMDWNRQEPPIVDDGLSAEEEGSDSDWLSEGYPTKQRTSTEEDFAQMFSGYEFSNWPTETVNPLSTVDWMNLGRHEEGSRNSTSKSDYELQKRIREQVETLPDISFLSQEVRIRWIVDG